MASIVTLFSAVVVACVGFGNANKEFVSVQCKSKNAGQFGQQSLLDCVIKTSEEAKDAKILIVTWWKVGDEEPLLRFDRGHLSQREGYKLAIPSWDENNMNVSLLIDNTAIEHEGEYSCQVITDRGLNKQQTSLSVTATYSKPTITPNPKDIQQGQKGTLTCDTDGGYPQGELRWYDDNKTDWTKSSKSQAKRGPDGRFQLSSTLELMPGSTFAEYTCVVFNASGGKEEEVTIDLLPNKAGQNTDLNGGSDNHSKWVAPVVVIGSLIVGLLLLLFFRRRSQRLRRPSAAALMGGHGEAVPCDPEEAAWDDKQGGA